MGAVESDVKKPMAVNPRASKVGETSNKVEAEKKRNVEKASKITNRQKKLKNDGDDKKGKGKSKFTKKVIFFGVINLLAVVVLLVLLNELPKKALELKTLVNAGIKAEASSRVNYTDLELQTNKEMIDKISKLFPNDEGLVDFIKFIEGVKAEGVLVNFSFASKEPVRDKTANLGIPVILEFRGSWGQIDNDLQKLQKAPYLFRPITVEAKPHLEENVVELMYGGFLYVDESL